MSTETTAEVRRIPGPQGTCEFCQAAIVWAVTVAGPNGPGGKAQPFDPFEDPAGNVALLPKAPNRLLARALRKDEDVDQPLEYRGLPHVASCHRWGAPRSIGGRP